MYNTYIPLLTYAHANGEAGSEVVPGLAEDLPKISNGGKTYTLTLRKGLKYSDGTPVKASDFPNSVERMFKINSAGSSSTTSIVGADKVRRNEERRHLGDQDQRQDRRDRHRPGRAARHLHQRAGACCSPPRCPPDTPAKNLTADPPPATGPYEITKSEPGPGLDLRAQPAVGEGQRAS